MLNPDETRVYTIRWSDLARYLKRGMQVVSITPGPGAETNMLAALPDELIADLEKNRNRRRKPSLREILADLTGWAAFKPGDVKRAVLSGGLGIDVICGLDGMWRMQLWREGSEPSLKEWETVLKSWPLPLPDGIIYKRFTHNNRRYIRGEWTISDGQKNNLPGADPGSKESVDRDIPTGAGTENSSLSLQEE